MNGLDPHGYSLLHYLAAINHVNSIQLWIDAGLKVDTHSKDAKTPLEIAIICQKNEAVDLLLSSNDKVTRMVLQGVRDLGINDSRFSEDRVLGRVKLI
jgi:ankyrin repeat protein